MINIFVVILNWNRKRDTLECLESLSKTKISNFKLTLLVVDNGSSDDSRIVIKKYLKKLSFESKNINGLLLKNTTNLGFAAGNNVGLSYAMAKRADFVVVINNDTLVAEDIFEKFLTFEKNHPDVGIFSPKIFFAPGYEFHKKRYKESDIGKVIWYAGGKIDWDNIYGKNIGVDKVDSGQFDKACEIDFATGACMIIRCSALSDVGLFDENYFMYLEDTDLSMRFRRKNWKIFFVPSMKIWHKVAQSSGIGSDLNDYFITRNRLLFGSRYATFRTRSALFRESIRFVVRGRKWQRKGVVDYYLGKFDRGSWVS